MPNSACAAAGFWIVDPPVSSARPGTAIDAETAVAVPAEILWALLEDIRASYLGVDPAVASG